MFIRQDGLCTDNKNSAKLFTTIDQAKTYVTEWRKTSTVNGKESLTVNIVEVETRPIINKVGKTIYTL
jgi:hypothetical protein